MQCGHSVDISMAYEQDENWARYADITWDKALVYILAIIGRLNTQVWPIHLAYLIDSKLSPHSWLYIHHFLCIWSC
jgi:hypothetical protein